MMSAAQQEAIHINGLILSEGLGINYSYSEHRMF